MQKGGGAHALSFSSSGRLKDIGMRVTDMAIGVLT